MEESLYHGYRRIDFQFEGRDAVLVFPKDENKTDKWMLKTEYFDAFPELEIAMLGRGYHLAYVKNIARVGIDADQIVKRDLADYLHETYGLSRRCVCIGMSYGGYQAVCFASRFPAYVSLLYLDAPLLCLHGEPGGTNNRWVKEQMDALGYTDPSELYVNNDQPIHRLKVLTDNRLPVALVYGDADTVVDPVRNAQVVEGYYKLHNVPIRVWVKPGCDHHPHVAVNLDEVIDFIEKNER